MFCEVTLLRKRGKRLKLSELAPPVRGRLSYDYRNDSNPMRIRKVFDLMETGSHTVPTNAGMLIEPVLLEITERGMIWRGYEIEPCGDGIYALLNHFLTYCAVNAQYCVNSNGLLSFS